MKRALTINVHLCNTPDLFLRYLFVEGLPYVIINGKTKNIDDVVLYKILDNTVDIYLANNLTHKLVF